MIRSIIAVLTGCAVFVPSAAIASSASTYHGVYTGVRYECQGQDVTQEVVGLQGIVVTGRWNLNETPGGPQISSIIRYDGKLHAAVAWTGPWQMGTVDGSALGPHHYETSVPAGSVQAILSASGEWTYIVTFAGSSCGSDGTSDHDTVILTGIQTSAG
jgi:hypothetical protein